MYFGLFIWYPVVGAGLCFLLFYVVGLFLSWVWGVDPWRVASIGPAVGAGLGAWAYISEVQRGRIVGPTAEQGIFFMYLALGGGIGFACSALLLSVTHIPRLWIIGLESEWRGVGLAVGATLGLLNYLRAFRKGRVRGSVAEAVVFWTPRLVVVAVLAAAFVASLILFPSSKAQR